MRDYLATVVRAVLIRSGGVAGIKEVDTFSLDKQKHKDLPVDLLREFEDGDWDEVILIVKRK